MTGPCGSSSSYLMAFLLDSLDEGLCEKVQERIKDTDSFVGVWMTFIERIQSTSLERFESLKTVIRNRVPSSYPGENLDLMASDMRKDAKVLDKAGQCDHGLTHAMIQSFILAGGKGLNGDAYRSRIRPMELLVEAAVLKAAYMSKDDAKTYMTTQGLTYDDVCTLVETTYVVFTNSTPSRWDPGSSIRDSKAPPAAFGNVAADDAPDKHLTKAEVMALIQSENTGSGGSAKKGNCHNCGKSGHWSRECPEPKKSNRGSNGNSNSGGGSNHGSRRSSKKDGSRGRSWKCETLVKGKVKQCVLSVVSEVLHESTTSLLLASTVSTQVSSMAHQLCVGETKKVLRRIRSALVR